MVCSIALKSQWKNIYKFSKPSIHPLVAFVVFLLVKKKRLINRYFLDLLKCGLRDYTYNSGLTVHNFFQKSANKTFSEWALTRELWFVGVSVGVQFIVHAHSLTDLLRWVVWLCLKSKTGNARPGWA